MKTCKHCHEEFNLDSPEKQQAGGFINECPDCLDEMGGDQSAPKYLGLASGDGKMSNLTIMKFQDEESKQNYNRAYRNNAGYNKGKSCQLGRHLTAMGNGYKFEIVGENLANINHKGKQ